MAMAEVANVKLSNSEKFTQRVMREFQGNAGELQVTDYQRQLIQGYFIGIDRSLKIADDARLKKNKGNDDHQYDNNLPVTWDNVNLTDLAIDIVHYARMGLDMMQSNHLSPIPYKNSKTKKYDVELMPGYNGIRYISEKYALDKPLAVTVELVYSTDTFKAIPKSANNKIEGYEFEINNPFDRGEVIGGFGYIEYSDSHKNQLIMMSRKEIEKRKPKYAAAEFWGGEKDKWKNGKKVGKEVVDGWFEQMCLKTIKREVYGPKHILLDPKKVDDAYQHMKIKELRMAEMEVQAEIEDNANIIDIDIISSEPEEQESGMKEIVDMETGEVLNYTPETQELLEPDF